MTTPKATEAAEIGKTGLTPPLPSDGAHPVAGGEPGSASPEGPGDVRRDVPGAGGPGEQGPDEHEQGPDEHEQGPDEQGLAEQEAGRETGSGAPDDEIAGETSGRPSGVSPATGSGAGPRNDDAHDGPGDRGTSDDQDASDDLDDGSGYDPEVTAVIRLPLRPPPPAGTPEAGTSATETPGPGASEPGEPDPGRTTTWAIGTVRATPSGDENAPGDRDTAGDEDLRGDADAPAEEASPDREAPQDRDAPDENAFRDEDDSDEEALRHEEALQERDAPEESVPRDEDASEDDAAAEDRSDTTAEIRLPAASLRPAGRPAPGTQERELSDVGDPHDLDDPGTPDDTDDTDAPRDLDDPGYPGGSREPSGFRGSPAFPGSPEDSRDPEVLGPETVPAALHVPVAERAVTADASHPGPSAPPGAESRDAAPVAPAAKPSRAANLLRTAMVWLPPLLTVEGLIMYVLALRVAPGPLWGVDLTKIDGLGLISALPPTAFAAILLMLVAFFVTIAQNTDRKFLLLFQIAAITFALHGGAALIQDEARFHTAYVHAGFVEYINRTGEASAILDARLAWPGFFALVAFVTKAAGVTDLTTIMRWTPLLSNLLYLLPFVLILRQVVATTRARWFAALLFVIVQWIGQDYFSSQGFTYAIYLAFVAIVLRWFGKVEPRTKPMPVKGRVRRLLARLDGLTPGELPHPTGVYDRTIMLIVLIGLFATATASHQITPFMMLGALTGLILLRRSSLSWGLPFFLGLMVLAWISYQTVTFWSGHIDQLFGGLGRILENLQSNTGDRIDGSDPKHALVLMARLGICGVILTLAAAGLFRRLRRGVGDRAALLLLCIPVLALGLQNYGGEIGLRIYLFALPGACILAAYAFFPNLPAGTEDAPEETVPIRRRNIRFNPELTRRISLLLAAGCAMALAMVFLVARYGNEQFERVSASEVAAMHYVYDHDEPSARVLYLVPILGEEVTPSIPWGERDFDKIAYEQVLVDKNPAQLSSVIQKLRTSPPNTYLVATRGQAGYLQLNHGFPTDWAPRFRAALDANKDLKRVFNGEDAAVYTLRSFPEGTEIPERAAPVGGNDPTSPWTPVGLVALGVTWIALFAYEVFLLRGRSLTTRTRRRILFVAVPAFLLAVGVIVERFVVIGYQIQ